MHLCNWILSFRIFRRQRFLQCYEIIKFQAVHVCKCKTCHWTSCDGLFEHYLFFMYCKSHRNTHDSVHLQHWFCVGSFLILIHKISDKCGYKVDMNHGYISKPTLKEMYLRSTSTYFNSFLIDRDQDSEFMYKLLSLRNHIGFS